MFILGSSRNLGAEQLAQAIENLLDLIRRKVSDVTKPNFHAGAADGAQHEAWKGALDAAVRDVRFRFDQVVLDAFGATSILAQHTGNKEEIEGGCSGVSSLYLPDLDLVFTQADLQKASALPLNR